MIITATLNPRVGEPPVEEPTDIDRPVVHNLPDPVPALLTPVTEGES